MANNAEKIRLIINGLTNEFPVVDAEARENLIKAISRIAELENSSEDHSDLLAAIQEAVTKLQTDDTSMSDALTDHDARITKAQNTADSNTKKYQALNETVLNEQTKLKDEIERATDVEGDISDLNTVNRDNLVSAINYLLTRVDKSDENAGDLTGLTTEVKDSLVLAINELKGTKAERTEVDVAVTTIENVISKVEQLESDTNTTISQVESLVTTTNYAISKINNAQSAIDNAVNNSSEALKAANDVKTSIDNFNVIAPTSVEAKPTVADTGSVAIGSHAEVTYGDSVAIGNYASSYNAGVVIGQSARDEGGGVVLGYRSSGGGLSVSLGQSAYSNALGVAIGCQTYATTEKSIAIGNDARTDTEDGAVAIGYGAYSNKADTVAFGHGGLQDTNGSTHNGPKTRRLINVTDPVDDQDAATKAYVDATNAALSETVTTLQTEVNARPSTRKLSTQTLTASGGTLTWTDECITDDSLIDVYASIPNIAPSAIEQSGTTVTVTFDAQDSDFKVAIVVM